MGLGEFKSISLNVRGLGNFKTRKSILTSYRNQKVYIIFFQETHSTIEKEKQWKAERGGPIELAHIGDLMHEVLEYYFGMVVIAAK